MEARHSITSPVCASIEGGTARPIAFAVFSAHTSYKDLGVQAVSVTHILRALVVSGAISGILAIFGPSEARIGPGFDCTKTKQPLAHLICASDTLSEIDLRLNQVYDAYRNALDTADKRRLDADEVQFLNRVIKLCQIPNDMGLALQELNEATDEAVERSACIERTYRSRIDELSQRAKNAAVPIPTQQSAAPPTPTKVGRTDTPAALTAAVAETVQLEHQHGVFMVPVRINDAITIPFILDSGAGDVSVPEDVFKTLLRTRTVSESDFLSPGTYINSDGSARLKQRFILHELRVGNHLIRDIAASVAPDKADPLLGQSFLGQLPQWAIDNKKHVLVIGVGDDAERPQAPTAQTTRATATSSKNARADDVQSAQSAVGATLRKNGGGLAPNRTSCPSPNLSDSSNYGWQHVDGIQIVPINETSNAILFDSHQCDGGNGHGQYLVISQNGSSRVITNVEIADMSFLGRISHVEGTSVFLVGARWGPNDPHCCPSREATLEYDVRTGQHKFTLGKRLQ